MSVKFQITLPEDLAAELKFAAGRMKMPLAEFIRQTMRDRLAEIRQRRPRASAKDPLAGIRGLIRSGEGDLSSRVDEILYGPWQKRKKK